MTVSHAVAARYTAKLLLVCLVLWQLLASLPRPAPPAPPLILLWNNYQLTGSRVYSRIFQRVTGGGCGAVCRVTRDKARQQESAAIVFHLPDLHWEGYNWPASRDPARPWILMTYESGNSVRQRCYYKGKYPVFTGRELAGKINRTMTLRADSDIVVRHGFVRRRVAALSTAELGQVYSQAPRPPATRFLSSGNETGTKPAAPVVWFVSHCNDFSGRMEFVRELQKHIAVDIYGECGPLSCGSSRNMGQEYRLQEDPCFQLVNTKYRFYLSFENAVCRDYITEKAFNALRLNTVPVMYGGANYSTFLPPGSFINAGEFGSPALLAAYLFSLLRDPPAFLAYFAWRPHWDIVSYTSVPDNCALCEQLVAGRLSQHSVYTDMFDWLVRRANCVYTSPSWGTRQLSRVWAAAGRQSH